MIREGTWQKPAIFPFLREWGNVSVEEMNHVFNNGIGMVIVVEPDEADEIFNFVKAMQIGVSIIGDIVPREAGADAVRVVQE